MAVQASEQPKGRVREIKRTHIRPLEFAEAVGVSKGLVYRWIYSGKLRASQHGRVWLIPASELEEFFQREVA